MLEAGEREEEQTWVMRCIVLAHGAASRQVVASPHVVHGEHVLTTYELVVSGCDVGEQQTLNAHLPLPERKMRPCLMLRLGAPRPETVAGVLDARNLKTFPYVETMESVLRYGDGLVYGGSSCARSSYQSRTVVLTKGKAGGLVAKLSEEPSCDSAAFRLMTRSWQC